GGGYGADQADGAVVDVLQPRLFGRAVRAGVAAGGSQYHATQHDPGTGHRRSGQTDQGAVRAVSEMTIRPRAGFGNQRGGFGRGMGQLPAITSPCSASAVVAASRSVRK